VKRLQAFLFLLLALAAGPLHAARIGVGGRVVGVDGKPALNVKVALIPVLPAIGIDRLELEGKTAADPAATATTDAAGLFHLTAPDAGMWKVRVEAAGYVPLEAQLVPLTQDAELSDARLVADAGLRVQVLDPQGRPAARAWVRVEAPRDDSSDSWQIPPRRVAFTDEQGVATLPRSRDEVLTVRAAGAGSVPGTRKNVHESSTEVHLAAGATRTIEVRDGGAKGKGIADVFVTLAESAWPVGRTAESGRLDLAVPADGVDLRLAMADGRRMTYRLRAAKPDELKPGEITPAVIVLKPAAPATGRIVAAGGAAGGQPVAGALAWLSGDVGAVVRSGTDGAIRFAHLPAEPTFLLAGAAGFLPASARTAAGTLTDLAPGVALNLVVEHPGYGPGAAPGVAVPSAELIRIVLPPTSRVSGHVSGQDGKPIAGATVALGEIRRGFAMAAFGAHIHQGVTDDDGGFSFEGVSPGTIYLAAEAPRYQRAELAGLEVKPGRDLPGVDLVLPPRRHGRRAGAVAGGQRRSRRGSGGGGALHESLCPSPPDGPYR
jgi:uncharacterized GH25 family protein